MTIDVLKSLTPEEGEAPQGESESITYTAKFRGATSVSSPSVTVYDNNASDVTNTVMPSGSPSVSGSVVTCPALTALDEDSAPYAVVVNATVDGNTMAGIIIVEAFDESRIVSELLQ